MRCMVFMHNASLCIQKYDIIASKDGRKVGFIYWFAAIVASVNILTLKLFPLAFSFSLWSETTFNVGEGLKLSGGG